MWAPSLAWSAVRTPSPAVARFIDFVRENPAGMNGVIRGEHAPIHGESERRRAHWTACAVLRSLDV
jgi:hypothetical protein